MVARRKCWSRNYDRRFDGIFRQQKFLFFLGTISFKYQWIVSVLFFKQSFEDAEKKKKEDEEEEGKPDPLTQLVTTFCRGAMTERSGALQEDPLYMSCE